MPNDQKPPQNGPVYGLPEPGQGTVPYVPIQPDTLSGPITQADDLDQKSTRQIISSSKLFRTAGLALIGSLLILGVGYLVISKTAHNVVKSPNGDIPDQSVSLGETTQSVDELRHLQPNTSPDKKVIINGDVITTGAISVVNNDFLGQIRSQKLGSDQNYLLPNSSGVFCLDSNNCNYASKDDVVSNIGGKKGAINIGSGLSLQGSTLTATGGSSTTLVTNSFVTTGVTTAINGVTGNISLGNGLAITSGTLSVTTTETTLNSLLGVVTLQGTANQIGVSSLGNTITFSTPQDINTTSSPTFQTMTLTTAGTQGGNAICDSSNNCGFSTVTGAYVQGGNSFGVTAYIGTNDSEDFVLETDNTARLTINSTGNATFTESLTVNKGALITAAAANSVGLVVKGANLQTANLQEWQSSTGNTSLYVTAIGDLVHTGLGVGGLGTTATTTISDAYGVTMTDSSYSGSISNFYAGGMYGQYGSGATLGYWDIYSNTAYSILDFVGAGGYQLTMGSFGTGAGSNNEIIFWGPGFNTSSISSVGTSIDVSDALTVNSASPSLGTAEKFRVNTPTTIDNSTDTIIATSAASSKGLVIQGVASQTANLQEWQDSNGALLTGINNTGDLYFSSQSNPIVLGKGDAYGWSGALVVNDPTNTWTGYSALAPGQIEVTGDKNNPTHAYAGIFAGSTDSMLYLNAQTTAQLTMGYYGYNASISGLSTGVLQVVGGSGIKLFGPVEVSPVNSSSVGLYVKAAASQTANLQEWQSSAGTVLDSITSSGQFNVSTTGGYQVSLGQVSNGRSGIRLGGDLDISRSGAASFVLQTSASGSAGLSFGGSLAAASDVTAASAIGGSSIGNTKLTIYTGALNWVGLNVRGTASQTGNLQEWQDSSAAVLGSIGSTGNLTLGTNTSGSANIAPVLNLRGYYSGGATATSFTFSGGGSDAYIRNTGNNYIIIKPKQGFAVENFANANRIFEVNTSGGGTFQSKLVSQNAGYIGTIVQGAASQSANLQEWQDSAGTTLTSIRANGAILGGGNGLALDSNSGNTHACLNTSGFQINAGGCGNLSVGLFVQPWQFNNIGLVVKGVASQSANLQEWRDSTNAVLANVTAAGLIQAQNGLEVSSTGAQGTVEKFRVNTPTTVDNAASAIISTGGLNNKGLVIQTAASQANTAYALQLQTSTGTDFFHISTVDMQYNSNGGNTWLGGATQSWRHSGGQTTTRNDAGAAWNQLMGAGQYAWSMQSAASTGDFVITGGGNFLQNSDEYERLRIAKRNEFQIKAYRTTATVTNKALTSNVATLTTSTAHGLLAGMTVVVSGVDATFNGTYTVASAPSATTFTYARVAADVASQASAGATVGYQTQTNSLLDFYEGTAGSVVASLTNAGTLKLNSSGTPGTVEKLRVNTPTTVDNAANAILTASASTSKALVIQAAASQTAELTQWQDSAGTRMAGVDAYGNVYSGNFSGVMLTTANTTLGHGAGVSASNGVSIFHWNNSVNLTPGEFGGVGFVTTLSTTASGATTTMLTTGKAASVVVAVKGTTSQSANLQEWQSSTGTILNRVTSTGAIQLGFNVPIQGEYSTGGSFVDLIKRGSSNEVWVGSTATETNVQGANYVNFLIGASQKAKFSVNDFSPTTASGISLGKNTNPWSQLYLKAPSAGVVTATVAGAASQTANLQEWQASTGTVLASISAGGNLTVVDATVNGTLTVNGNSTFNGHIITGNSSGSTSVAAGAGAGTGASASVSGNDTSGKITITTGTGSSTGVLGTVTFAHNFGSAPNIILTPANGNGSSIQYFAGSATTSTFTVDANNAPADGTTYTYYYQVMQ